MATSTFTPELHPVFNELDKIGILLGLPRLEEERNAEYRVRLFDVLVHRASSTYKGLLFGVTRELGLSLFQPFTLSPRTSPTTGLPLATNPAVVFSETKCYVYEDYTDGDDGLALTIDRTDQDGGGYTIGELAHSIEGTGYFEALMTPGQSTTTRSMTIFNQSTVITVATEELDTAGARVKLKHDKLIPDTAVIRSSNLTDRVSSLVLLRRVGQYYLDHSKGLLYSTAAPAPGSTIRYQYRDDNYKVLASPVIIHNLQSSDYMSKMFEQETLNGETTNGSATPLGLDLINELLSVYPLGWGP